jgi:uncharacterized membrane protein YoaK (UPF0700 family)
LTRRPEKISITLHTPDTIYSLRHTPSWFALACAAGAVNGFGFLTCEQFVSHVTGTATRIGLEWPHLGLAAEYTVVLVCFVAGAVASVLWIQGRAYWGRHPQWASPLFAVALILTSTALAGGRVFGPFGAQVAADPPPVVLLSVLAFAMGLQNAAAASTTGLAVRTTHLTGPATALGIHLGTAYFRDRRRAGGGAQRRLAARRQDIGLHSRRRLVRSAGAAVGLSGAAGAVGPGFVRSGAELRTVLGP